MTKTIENCDFDKIISEIKKSDYSMYEHKKTKKYLIEILDKYLDDYQIYIVNENWYHDRQLWITCYDPFSYDTVSIDIQLL